MNSSRIYVDPDDVFDRPWQWHEVPRYKADFRSMSVPMVAVWYDARGKHAAVVGGHELSLVPCSPLDDLFTRFYILADQGFIVVLPDGSRVGDFESPTGWMMAPVADLRPVAKAGGIAGLASLAAGAVNPVNGAEARFVTIGAAVGTGGTFDYQRSGNQAVGLATVAYNKLTHSDKPTFTQRRQFKHVSNFNVGLFCQQFGLTLDDTLKMTGRYARMFSSNAAPDQPYGLQPWLVRFATLGYKAGASGMFKS